MKKIIGFTLISAVIFMIVFSAYINKTDNIQNAEELREERIAKVIESGRDKYDLDSYMIGRTDPTIWIETEKIENKDALLKYLKQNIKESDLKKYNVEISKPDMQ
ncbi:hypothetical protein [Bacillus cereus]|uniref:hypothetical protein n=1 Tax=Bacillus cereus TaxID=1396 RepID=UPI001CF6C31E|nr:hypothetical protein [Bacillus cereus]MCB4332806.1 hypothetical protein [Bacillus cereus]